MAEERYSKTLEMLKLDLGIRNTAKDTYYESLLKASEQELNRKGVILDIGDAEDMMLLSDFAAWNYRNRQQDLPLARNIQLRIRNRVIRARAGGSDG